MLKHIQEVDGIPQLLKDPSLFTHLEAIDYDDHHNIDDVRREKVARAIGNKLFDRPAGVWRCVGDRLRYLGS